MTTNININPILTTNATGTFGVDWGGGFQGVAMPDPAIRNALAHGLLDPSETLPMWGGLAIAEFLGGLSSGPNPALGPTIKSPTTVGGITGFSTFDQAHAALATPQSPVPLAYSGGDVMFYRLKSGARLWLPASANLVTTLAAGVGIGTQVSWDFVGRQCVPYVAAYAANTPTSGAYVSGTGYLTLNFSAAPAVVAGDWLGVSGFINTAAQANGSWQVQSQTSTTVVLLLPTGLTITNSDFALGSPASAAGGGALPVQSIIDTSFGKSMQVSYAAATGFATWNRTGNTILAVI
jgi:hypothetical protein